MLYCNMAKYGKLTLGAVPIGDFKDASLNLIDYIVNHKIILVENIDIFNELCKNLNIKTEATVIQFNDLIDDLTKHIDTLKDGIDILLLSDEGTAGIIDPGAFLLLECRKNEIPVKIMPGPNSIIPSVLLANMGYKFYFYGPGDNREQTLKDFGTLVNYNVPIVFFISDEYRDQFLNDATNFFGGDRRVCICANVTKINECIIFTKLQNALDDINQNNINNSIVLVIDKDPTL